MSNSSLILVLAACGIIFIAGCASTQTENTPSLRSQAGFRAHPPQTAKQKELYATLPSNRLEHATMDGKERYAFKDEKAGVIYFGEIRTSTVPTSVQAAARGAGTGREGESEFVQRMEGWSLLWRGVNSWTAY